MTNQEKTLLDSILSHPEFSRWAQGCAPEMDDYWRTWTGDAPIRQRVLERAKSLSNFFDEPTPTISDQFILQKVSEAIAQASLESDDSSTSKPISRYWLRFSTAAAASLLLLLGVGWWLSPSQSSLASTNQSSITLSGDDQKEVDVRTVQNTSKQPMHLQLADGSSVVLQPGSTLKYPDTFASEKREVELVGEAFFEVVKNKEKPFFVLANRSVAKVLGTSFRLKAKPNTHFLEVNVKTGSVVIYRNNGQNGKPFDPSKNEEISVLKENQKAIFEFSGDELMREIRQAEVPVRLAIEELNFVYEGTPLAQVLSDLEQAYGVDIRYDRTQLAHCSLTAELGDEPLGTKLKWISSILEATFQMEGNQITLSGNPCL
jgi:transmembrane sensor